MSRKKIKSEIEKLVLNEKRKSPYLGVRALASLLKNKYKVSLSKSAIHNILKGKGLKSKAGRKEARLIYKNKNEIKNCGLVLLEAVDDQVGLFEHLSSELRTYFPKLDKYFFNRFLILAVFSSLLGKTLKECIHEEGFLRLAGLKRLPISKIDYFDKILAENKLVVKLKPVKENVRLASTIKFYFKNGHEGYSDAKMSTFWDRPCNLEYFYTPLKAARRRIEQMIDDKIIIIGYTKSFDYLSALVFDFMKGLESGLKRIQFLNGQGEVLGEFSPPQSKFRFAIGYYPKIISKGVLILNKQRRFRRLFWEEIDEFYGQITISKFLQLKEKEGVILNNVLIRKDLTYPPVWGVFTNFNVGAKYNSLFILLKKYLYLWPYLDKGFSEDMKIFEKAFALPNKKKEYLCRILPEKLVFTNVKDFVWVGQILSVMFKELIWGWEPKAKSGSLIWGKAYVKLFFKKTPKEMKKNFNKASLCVDRKRAFIL